jgi:hypothetical protein
MSIMPNVCPISSSRIAARRSPAGNAFGAPMMVVLLLRQSFTA